MTLPDGVDLHARPAADFVRTAMGFGADIQVAAGEREADAKSLLSVLALGSQGRNRAAPDRERRRRRSGTRRAARLRRDARLTGG